MLDVNAKKEELTEIARAERIAREKRNKNRRKIPTAGRAWVDQQDDSNFFKKQQEEKAEKERVRKVNAVKSVSQKRTILTEIRRKREKAIEHERHGTLPRTWKSPAQHAADEEKAKQKLQEALKVLDKLNNLPEIAGEHGIGGRSTSGSRSFYAFEFISIACLKARPWEIYLIYKE